MPIAVFVITMALIFVFMLGCSAEKPKPSGSESTTSTAAGRPDTRGIEAASAVGYDGPAMRRSVDKALNANEARTAEQQKAIEQATGGK
jgi:hypothetical protein